MWYRENLKLNSDNMYKIRKTLFYFFGKNEKNIEAKRNSGNETKNADKKPLCKKNSHS